MTSSSQIGINPTDLEASRIRQEKRLKEKNRRRSRKSKNGSGSQASTNSVKESVSDSASATLIDLLKCDRAVQTDAFSCEGADESTIACNVNGETVFLHFRNSGNNGAMEIATYLQEKLDVLEFLQMDCSRMETSIVFPTSRVNGGPSDPAPTLSVSRRGSSVNSSEASMEGLFGSSDTRRLERRGFFIGTPSARDLSLSVSSMPSQGDVVKNKGGRDDHQEESSNLMWETESMASPSSKRRSCSVSSVSSVESVKSWKRPDGMFGRSRMTRLLADLNRSDMLSDTGSDILSPSRRRQLSWWESGGVEQF